MTANPLEDPRVQPDSYIVYPSCYDQMGNTDRYEFCLNVVNGHADGWSIRRGMGRAGVMALSRDGEWVWEARHYSEEDRERRYPLEEALAIALKYVDELQIAGSTAADCAAMWPRTPDQDA